MIVIEGRPLSKSARRVPSRKPSRKSPARRPRLDLEARSRPVPEHAHEGHEEVRRPVAQLLDERVLVRRALVAVDGQPLVDDAAREVLLLADRLHDQLLQVAAEEEQPVLVGQDDHGLRAAPLADRVPGEREERGRVPAGLAPSRGLVHRRRPREEGRPRRSPAEPPGGGPPALVTDVRPPTQSHIGKRARKPCSRACRSRRAPLLRDGHGVGAEVEAARRDTRPPPRRGRCGSRPCRPTWR